MGKIKEFITKIPVPVCGLALGMASLDLFVSQYEFYAYSIFALMSAILVILFSVRAVIDFKGVLKEIENPVVFGVFPTYCMALMLLSTYAKEYIGDAAVVIWAFAIILSFVMMFFFVKKFVLKFDINKVFPSWIVIFVGYVVGSVTSPVFGMETIGKVLFCFGITFYFVVMPIIVYRIIVIKNIPESAVPNIAIITAPINLCIVGYFASFGSDLNGTLIAIMAVFGMVSYAAVLIYMPVMLNRKFYPSYAAFTFPLVISAVSIQRLGVYYGVSSDPLFHAIQTVTTAIAVLIVVYVLIRYLMFFYKNVKNIRENVQPV